MPDSISIPDAAFRDLAYGDFSRAQRIIIGHVVQHTIADLPATIPVRALAREHGICHPYISKARDSLLALGVIRAIPGGFAYSPIRLVREATR